MPNSNSFLWPFTVLNGQIEFHCLSHTTCSCFYTRDVHMVYLHLVVEKLTSEESLHGRSSTSFILFFFVCTVTSLLHWTRDSSGGVSKLCVEAVESCHVCSHHLNISTPITHQLTSSPYQHPTVSLSHHLTISLSLYLHNTPAHHLTISTSHRLTVSPSHHLLISLSP